MARPPIVQPHTRIQPSGTPRKPARDPDRYFLGRFWRAAKWGSIFLLVLLATAALLSRYIGEDGAPFAWLEEDRTFTVAAPVDWSSVDAEIRAVFLEARRKAEQRARQELDAWQAELMQRVEEDFLPWYFGFWNQQWRDLKALGYLAADWVGGAGAQDTMMADFRDAFAVQVMPPGETQMRMEAIARESLRVYLEHARSRLREIPAEYQVPRDDWQQHLSHIGLQLAQARTQDEQVPTTLKGLVTFGAAGTTAVVLRGSRAMGRVGAAAMRWAPRAGAAAGETALVGSALRGRVARTGGRRAARTGGRLGGRVLGAAALVGFLAWDVYDYSRTEAELRPKLRKRLAAYLDALRQRMLRDSGNGVLAPVHEVESAVHDQLSGASSPGAS
ncbi:hypothetical protein [Thiohalorhabdus methylotrophus]|uniref:Uncharacterized protein n=1 Tax=Thiohalorhabdus methylotrophus TaxID=3242694 RepID=A0ABV4TSM0_9GAMM